MTRIRNRIAKKKNQINSKKKEKTLINEEDDIPAHLLYKMSKKEKHLMKKVEFISSIYKIHTNTLLI
jgi:hypothetical protein